jgi:hypothetical protein
MARIQEYVKTKPYTLFLNQIEMEGNSGIQKSLLKKKLQKHLKEEDLTQFSQLYV